MTQAPVNLAPSATPAIKPATGRDVPAIAGVLADAFQDDRTFQWWIPDGQRRHAILPRFFDLYARATSPTFEAYLTDGGAAIWIPPGLPTMPPENEEEFAAAIDALTGEDAERGFAIMAMLEENIPATPHYHCAFVGVERANQGRGTGSRLLRAVLDRLDDERIPAYLEATSEENRRLYERHGFVVKGELTVADCPPLFAMWREPATK